MENRINIDSAKSVLFLTAALVMIATWAVGATGWTRGINILTFVGLGSILIGTMLARSLLPGFVAHIFSIIIGIGWSFWVTSRLLPAHYTWLERWENLAARLYNWYLVALQGGTSYDNLMFLLQMGVIIWGMGYLTIWFVFRSGRPWPAIVPGGLVLLINLYYAPKDITFWFILYMLVSLLLIVRFNLFDQELKWRHEGVFFRPDISFDFLRDGFIFSVLVIAFAWLTPPLIDAKTLGLFDQFQGSWRDVQDDWNRLFADLNYRDRTAYDTFGSSLTLGGPRNLSDDPVMEVKVEGIGRYWRAAVYDYYTGDGWLTRDEDKASFGPEAPLTLPVFEMREAVTQTYTFQRDNATVLYAMAHPISLDRSARVSFNALPLDQITQAASAAEWLGNSEPWAEEITYIRSDTTVDQGESYQIVSLASRASINQLRNAGADYPIWVTERYLNLPPSTTDRTRQLAQQLTTIYDNNFDKAQAIERFLRNELRYNERLSAPPAGVDKVDYIIFTAKEAYCDYYATAMIVMLRSLGIPARLAAGFAQGAYDSETGAFRVLNRDAHSWVEVYFPTYGWVEFEPTAAQPNIIRPTSSEEEGAFASGSLPNNSLTGPDELPDRPEDTNIPIDAENMITGLPFSFSLPFFGTTISIPRAMASSGAVISGVIILLFLGGLLWWRQQTQPQRDNNAFSLYQHMGRLAGWMGLAIRPWQTPYEHAGVLQRNLPAYRDEIRAITEAYVVHTYSNHRLEPTPASAESVAINQAWNRLRPAMIKQALRRYLPAWLKKS